MTPDQAQQLHQFIHVFLYSKNWDGNRFLVQMPPLHTDALTELQRIAKQCEPLDLVADKGIMRQCTNVQYFEKIQARDVKRNNIVLWHDSEYRVIGEPDHYFKTSTRGPCTQVRLYLGKL